MGRPLQPVPPPPGMAPKTTEVVTNDEKHWSGQKPGRGFSKRALGENLHWNGRPLYVTDPEQLYEAFDKYQNHLEQHPDHEDKAFHGRDGVTHTTLKRTRPYLIETFCAYLGIHHTTWRKWKREREELVEAIEYIEHAIMADKVEGAYTGRYNASFAMRHMGMVEKQELTAMHNHFVPASQVDEEDHLAIHIHPDDPDPLNLPRPTYSRSQLRAGVPFTPPAHDSPSISDKIIEHEPVVQQESTIKHELDPKNRWK